MTIPVAGPVKVLKTCGLRLLLCRSAVQHRRLYFIRRTARHWVDDWRVGMPLSDDLFSPLS